MGVSYNQTLAVANGSPPYTWATSSGSLPAGLSLNATTGMVGGTPTTAGGPTSITFRVTDNVSATAAKALSITINAAPVVNHPPVLPAIGNKSVTEGQLLAFTISATDPDGDNLTYSASNLPSGASFTPANRTFGWTPTAGQAGTYLNVSFWVSDGALAASENITITVSPAVAPSGGGGGGGGAANSAPVLVPIGSKTVNEGQVLSFSMSATDANGDALTYSAANLPQGRTFDPATMTFSWTPAYGQAGTYRDVHFQVSDGRLITWEKITIEVAKDPPPQIAEISVGDVAAYSSVIRWKTDKPSTSQVEYWASPSKLSPPDETMATQHLVRLTDLAPGTDYHFKTISRDAGGNVAVSAEQAFTTMAPPPAPLRVTLSQAQIDLQPGVSGTANNTLISSQPPVLNSNSAIGATSIEARPAAGASQHSPCDVAPLKVALDEKPAAGSTKVQPVTTPVPTPKTVSWETLGMIIAAGLAVAEIMVGVVIHRRRDMLRDEKKRDDRIC